MAKNSPSKPHLLVPVKMGSFPAYFSKSSINLQELSNVGEAAVIVSDAPPDANRQDLFILATHLKEKYEKDYSNGITRMCTHIDDNIPYVGVPGDVSQRKAWYAVLNNYLKLISVELPKHSEDVQRDVFVQLNYVSGDCGGAWMDEARTQYLRLVGEADVLVNLKDPAVKAFTILADFKKRAMAQLNFHYVEKNGYDQRHVNIFLDKHLGPLLGVAGAETQVEDVYAPGELEQRPLFEDFSQFYNPLEMTRWFEQEIPQRLSIRKAGESFGPYLQQWIEDNMDQVSRLLGKDAGQFNAEYDESSSWVAENCFLSLEDKVNPGSLSLQGAFLLLHAIGALAPKT